MTVEPLDWDTEFFGVRIGRAEPGTDLESTVASAARQALECVYVESETAIAASELDLRHVDTRVVLAIQVNDPPDAPSDVATDAVDPDALGAALDRLAPWSRFARDPGFGTGVARRMYDAWLRRALTAPDEEVGVIESAGGRGFVTVRFTRPAEIGLISTTVDGHNHGRALLQWAMSRIAPHSTLQVATQADNDRALRLYEANGFVRQAETFMYHLWITAKDQR